MKERGLATSTIKTGLAGIRFFNDQNSNAKNHLSDNSKFDLDQRSFGGVNRSWTNQEHEKFKELCINRNMNMISSITVLARNEGLRLHEALRIDRNIAEKAILTNMLNIKGKGGKIRNVPLSAESKKMLINEIKEVERGQKVFVKEGEPTHLVIKQVQNFINRNREQFQNQEREVNITFHGLRHTFAQENYNKFIENGLSKYDARLEVSELLGHERDDVTRIYLA